MAFLSMAQQWPAPAELVRVAVSKGHRMRLHHRLRLLAGLCTALSMFWLLGGSAWADHREYDLAVWQEYRAAKRQQIRDLCDIWFAEWRPGAVGRTYLDLADQYANIDLSRCSPAMRQHILKAERICTEIAELFGQGSFSGIGEVLSQLRSQRASGSNHDERGSRILELMRDLAESENEVIKQLSLDK